MGTVIRFYMDAYKNAAKSTEAGREVFDTVPWIEKRVVGEPDSICGPVHKMQPDPRLEYPQAWAKFQQDHASEGIVGTPLKEVPWLGRGEVETLQHAGVKTLENLAEMSDGTITSIPGGLALRKKAREMIKAAADAAPLQAMAEELSKRDAEIAALKEQIADLAKSRRKKASED